MPILGRESGLFRRSGKKAREHEFAKMSGSGNDFVIFDDRDGRFADGRRDLVRRICSRRLSVGADGVVFIEDSRKAGFRMVYYNADGERATFCANGTRCAARFAFIKVITKAKMTIETDWAVIAAEIEGERVRLELPAVEVDPVRHTVKGPGGDLPGFRLSVGVPHFVVLVSGALEGIDVEKVGRAVREHEDFAPEGTNVHFVRMNSEHEADIRSYERGVEAETLSCGSGLVAAALVGLKLGRLRSPVVMNPRCGIPLEVNASVLSRGFAELSLLGDARMVLRAQLGDETTQGFPLDDPAAPAVEPEPASE